MGDKTSSPKKTTRILEDMRIGTKMKLSALWTVVRPFSVTQLTLLAGSVFITIPCVMVFLSLILKPKVNRRTNIIVAVFYTVVNSISFLATT
jgi:hypothetical protein